MENFVEWLVIHQSFPYKPLSLNVSPRSIHRSFTRQTFVNDSFIKVLHYTVFTLGFIHMHEIKT